MPYVVRKQRVIQYDGTNGEYIAGEWSDGNVTILSDDGQTLSLKATHQPECQTTLQAGDWVIADDSWVSMIDAAYYETHWHEVP